MEFTINKDISKNGSAKSTILTIVIGDRIDNRDGDTPLKAAQALKAFEKEYNKEEGN